MKKIALFLIGIVLILGSLLFFLYGTAQLASASNPPNIQISDPSIVIPKSVSQNQALSIILGSAVTGIIGLISLGIGIVSLMSSSQSDSENEQSSK